MSEPIVFISNQRIKRGKLEGYKQYYEKVAKFAEAKKPGTVAHLAYLSEDGAEATVVTVFPDAQAMERHMRGVGEIAQKEAEFVEVVSWEIYGKPSNAALEAMLKLAGPRVTLRIKPKPIGGYIRLKAAEPEGAISGQNPAAREPGEASRARSRAGKQNGNRQAAGSRKGEHQESSAELAGSDATAASSRPA